MSKTVGTISRGIRTPIIRNGDNLVEIIADSILAASRSSKGFFPVVFTDKVTTVMTIKTNAIVIIIVFFFMPVSFQSVYFLYFTIIRKSHFLRFLKESLKFSNKSNQFYFNEVLLRIRAMIL